MNFSSIIGHDFIKSSLKDTLNTKKISHAYIFDGAEGIGKERCAKIFARGILCDNFNIDLCEECNNCRLTINDVHPDLKVIDFTIGEDGKQRASISVEAIRQFKKEVYLRPFYGERKIYILKNAEKMTVEAQNAMLKIFEEPPEYITIILITNGLSKILSTIKSRAVIFNFPTLGAKELEKYLNIYYNDIEDKEIYAHISDGSISKMIQLISDEDSLLFRESVLSAFIKIIRSNDSSSYNDLFDIFMKNKEKKEDIIKVVSIFTMDAGYIKASKEGLVVNIDKKDELNALINILSINNIFNIENLLGELSYKLSKNANYKLAILNTLLSIREEIHG
ncbi:MAG: hypothetical protein IKZ35_00740 [Clostridia bacterium]|nr:hypothetical protein [Oscillospiraceae bacterium]MBR4892492.1 hypothetical protein [Clostridia bacterium]